MGPALTEKLIQNDRRVMRKAALFFWALVCLSGCSQHQVGRQVVLPGLLPEFTLRVVNEKPGAQPEAAFCALYLQDRSGLRPLENLAALRGKVRLRNGVEALDYVRFGTPLSTFLLWPGPGQGLEVLRDTDVPKMFDYGLFGWRPSSSGTLAVLSAPAWAQGKFTDPRVRPTPDGWVVERWMWCGNRLERVSEAVRRDGSYSRSVLVKRPLPKLVGTKWRGIVLL